MVFQSYALYPHMNVYENMSFGLKMEKHSKNDIEKKVNEAAKTLKSKICLIGNQKNFLEVKDRGLL